MLENPAKEHGVAGKHQTFLAFYGKLKFPIAHGKIGIYEK
jgi:hypothetical protein